jgi:hypothetical protein
LTVGANDAEREQALARALAVPQQLEKHEVPHHPKNTMRAITATAPYPMAPKMGSLTLGRREQAAHQLTGERESERDHDLGDQQHRIVDRHSDKPRPHAGDGIPQLDVLGREECVVLLHQAHPATLVHDDRVARAIGRVL